MPLRRARFSPFGVKYSPTVSFSAPPLARLVLFLEDALAVGAGADHGRVGVVVQRRGEDLRRGARCCGRSGRRRARRRSAAAGSCGRCRPWCAISVDTTTSPCGQEDAGAEHRLVEQAAGVFAQVEDDPFGPFALDLFDPVGERCWPASLKLSRAARSRACLPSTSTSRAARRSAADLGPGQRQLRAPSGSWRRARRAVTSVPSGPLDLLRRFGRVEPGDRLAVDRDDRVARPRSRPPSAGEPWKTSTTRRPFFDGDDAQPDPGEAPFDLLVEPFQAFRREVVGEAVFVAFAQLADHPLQGGVAELGVADLAEVVVLDDFRGFADQAGRFFGERFAGEAGQLRRVAAEPDPRRRGTAIRATPKAIGAARPHAALRPGGSDAA